MTKYGNKNGVSGVTHYRIGKDYIEVKFKDSFIYGYTCEKTGVKHVSRMKELAQKGIGLSTYISKHVKGGYAYKVEA